MKRIGLVILTEKGKNRKANFMHFTLIRHNTLREAVQSEFQASSFSLAFWHSSEELLVYLFAHLKVTTQISFFCHPS